MKNKITKVIECPRDAMQGLDYHISTENKIRYINQLLKVGFDVLDCGSFVSPKAVPMLADTAEVLENIEWQQSDTKLLVIVANEKGADKAVTYEQVSYLGYPFSISEQFQMRNTNHNQEESLETLANILNIAGNAGKEVVVYLSMGFGNPYGETWSPDLTIAWAKRIAAMGVKTISLSDTIGMAKPADINYVFTECVNALPDIEFGVHLHTRPDNYLENITAAYDAGCRRFDGAIKGFGGCPFASDALTGNLPTEALIRFLHEKEAQLRVDDIAFAKAYSIAATIFVAP